MDYRTNFARPPRLQSARPLRLENAKCVTNKCAQLKSDYYDDDDESDYEEENSNNSEEISSLSPVSMEASVEELRKRVLMIRGSNVSDKMERNSAKLLKYTSSLSDSSKQWVDMSIPEEDKLTFRSQKVLCSFTNSDAGMDGKDESAIYAAPIIFGGISGGKTAIRPVKLPPQQNVPPYTTWMYLDRNQRMTEDQSVQGRRRIYYDRVGNETLIASDSEEEEVEDEEPKHDFSKGEDYIIWTAVQELGASDLVFAQIALCIQVSLNEVQTRYELLLNDVDKQAQCEAYWNGSDWPVLAHTDKRRGTSVQNRLVFEETGKFVEEEKVEAKDLVAAMDSFDNLFCRRCLVFDCRLHGCSQPLVHPSERQPLAIQSSDSLGPCGPDCHLLGRHDGSGTSSLAVVASLQSQARHGGTGTSSVAVVTTLQVQGTAVAGIVSGSQSQVGHTAAVTFSLPVSTTSKPLHALSARESVEKLRVAKRQKTHEGETDWSEERRPSICATLCRISQVPESGAEISAISDKMANLPTSKAENTPALAGTAEAPIIIGCEDTPLPPKRGQPSLASRLTSHKKLARSGSRHLGQGKVGTMLQGLMNPPLSKKLEGIEERSTGEEISGIVSAVALVEEVVTMDIDEGRVDASKDQNKVTSPKKLARTARKPAVKPTGVVESKQLQTSGGPLKSNQEGETRLEACEKEVKSAVKDDRPAVKEKTRNTAAKKLARSSRKCFAEKVAGAIQLQQLQVQVDPTNSLSRRGKDPGKVEPPIAGGTCKVLPSTGTVCLIEGVNESQNLLTHAETACGARSNQPIEKIKNMGVFCEEKFKDFEIKQYQTPERQPVTSSGERKLLKSHQTPQRPIVMNAAETRVFKSEVAGKAAKLSDSWTPLEKGLYEKGLQIFGKSSCLIAKNMLKGCKTCAEVGEYMVAQEAATWRGSEAALHQFPDSLACAVKWDVARARARFYGRRRGSRKLKFTLKSAGQSATRKRMVNGKDEPCRQYTPCGCLFACGKQCPCQLSGTCCEKYCGCAKNCKNRFRGCHCAKSQCCSRQCPCFAAGRNCDPDVCRNCWIGCGDGNLLGPPQREDKDNYQCHNMMMLLKQQQRVLLSRSDVAGWGAFLKDTVNKHDYLGEYTGELISHREADKRGKIYDRENSSFLFNLNDQYVLDACRKGDKLKFANHSPNPNCYAKVIMVAGDHRVGIFAKERIMAGEELFYDYRYEAGSAPAWARRADDSNNGKKDDSGPSERRSKQAS